MNRINIILATSLMAACLAACSSDDDVDRKEVLRPMIVDVTENPMTDSDALESKKATRAGVTTTTSLDKFYMNYQGSQYTFTKNKTTNEWSTATWPVGVDSNTKIDFYAYTQNGGFNYKSGDPYVAFTVQGDVASQYDLLVAEHKQIAQSDASGHVSLTFDHACAAVQFNVQITNTLRTNRGADLTVNSIYLKNVNNQGDYYYGSKSWTNVSGSANYELTNSEITVTTAPQRLACNYLLMIPQSREANGTSGTYLEINYTTSSNKTANIPMAINWEPGKLYTINIKLGTKTIES